MFGKIKSSKYWIWPVSRITNLVFKVAQQIRYYRGAGKAFEKPKKGLIPITNSSGGLLREIIENRFISLHDGMRILLVSEPASAAAEMHNYLRTKRNLVAEVAVLESIIDVPWNQGESAYDIANLTPRQIGLVGSDWDLVICQSLLEHVFDPVGVLDSLSVMMKEGAVLAVQTVNVFMDYHAYPIDCLRFYPDFFYEYGHRRNFGVNSWVTQASVFAIIESPRTYQ